MTSLYSRYSIRSLKKHIVYSKPHQGPQPPLLCLGDNLLLVYPKYIFITTTALPI